MDSWNEHPGGALDAYLDGELSLEGSLAVEDHLAACESCRRQQVTLGALHRALLAKGRPPEPAPPPKRGGATVRRRRRNFALGGAMAVAAALAAVMLGPGGAMPIRGEEAKAHAPAVKDGLASEDPAVIERWLAGRLPESIPLARGGEGFSLRDARVDSIDGRPVATAVYQLRGHIAGVSAWRSSEPDSEPEPAIAGPWTVCRWAHRGVAYWMVSSAGADDLRALALLIKSRPI